VKKLKKYSQDFIKMAYRMGVLIGYSHRNLQMLMLEDMTQDTFHILKMEELYNVKYSIKEILRGA